VHSNRNNFLYVFVECFSSDSCEHFFLCFLWGASSPALDKPVGMSSDMLYHFDVRHTAVGQRFDPSLAPPSFAHVQVEVKRVLNPSLHPANFNVFFQPAGKNKFMLGTFSLYPANDPGIFIVPAQGNVKGDGSLILSLRLPAGVSDSVAVTTGTMMFVK
jgi:hypothetical protein